MKVTVDDDTCKGHGICLTICPEVFTMNDDGYTIVGNPVVPGELEDAVKRAVQSCPERAIATSGD